MDTRTLQYWHKLEHFYPYLVGEQSDPNIKSFTIDSVERFEQLLDAPLPPGKAVRYYVVYLGLFRVDKALESLEQGMGKKMRFRDSGDDESCFCTFKMSAGRQFNPYSFKISSFPWAIHRVRDGKIVMDQWDDDFHRFETGGFLRLRDHGEPLDYCFLLGLRDWFAQHMNWEIAYSEYWMRIDRAVGDAVGRPDTDDLDVDDAATETADSEQSEDSQNEDVATDEQIKQNDLLNSFYIRDLERIIDSVKKDDSAVSDCFHRFLDHNTENKIDIEKDREALLELLAPQHLPKGKWPSNYGLRLMQQVDVNAFLCDDSKYHQSLFSVNGPPGTGKTTLLKDIIAAIVVERAIQMCEFDMPDEAFGETVCEIKTTTLKGSFTNSVRDIALPLKQYGILVASNNNGAVENVTHTLPALREISTSYMSNDRRYFSEVSDLLFGKGKTWAINAAALGNQSNRRTFVNAFWPINPQHEGYDFNTVLRMKVRTPSRKEWAAAKNAFQTAVEDVRQEYQKAEEAYICLKALLSAKADLLKLNQNVQEGNDNLKSLNALLAEQKTALEELELKRTHTRKKLKDMEESQSFFFLKKLFSFNTPFMQTYRSLEDDLHNQVKDLHAARDALYNTEQDIRRLQTQMEQWREAIKPLEDKLSGAEESLREFQQRTESPLRMDAYFEEVLSEEANLSSPWGYSALNQCRAKLFIDAMALHKTFVQNSKRLRDNLDAFSKMLRGKIPAKQLPVAAPVLLQSFMLVVPVISTTFASVGSFLRYIPQGEIAYLFVDEAGQAMPQSAAGAVWRARNVIAVGDPLQIEPVVTLHDSVIYALAEHFEQSDILANKYTSVQSLADLSNRIGGFRTVIQENDLWIGAPLVVHNRCQKQIFDIANKIAYNEKMIHATEERPATKCQWLHVSGNSQNGHYVPNQASAISQLVVSAFDCFAHTRDESQKYPAIFVISPFRSVRSGMAAYFRQNMPALLEQQQGINVPKNIIREWIKNCIGTIHTFQGKETDTVVLCLGVDSNGKSQGAVEWACERPNILNVAVTRSKENLYIVGDRAIWAEKPFFETAFEICHTNSN